MAKTLLDNIIESIKDVDGRLIKQSGTTEQMISDLNYKVVAPAKSAADSAVSAADAAVASAQVTSATVSAVASATAEAKQGANESMSRAKSAWDVATDAKEAVTEFDPLLKSAQSDASKALAQIADTASALSDAKTVFTSDVAVAKNLASTAQTTANNAVESASSVADDLAAVANQAKANTNGITKVTSDVGLLQTTVANNSGNISTIQETAKQIQQAVSDNAGNITVATQTADSAVAVASDARSNATVASQTASQASITASNASGQAASAVLTANGAMTTASNAESDATVAIQTASGASLTATNAQSDATIAKQTASEATVQASNAASDFAQLSVRANKIETNVVNNTGAIASVQQTANGLTNTVGKVDDRVKTIEDKTNWTTKTGSLDMDTLTTTQNIYYRDTNLQNADGETGWAYIQVVSMDERVTQTVWHDRSSIQHTRTGAVSGSSYNWDAWNTTATNAQVVQVKQTVDGIATTINDPKTGLNATYQTAQGNASTISNVKGDIAQLQTTANGLTSRVGSLESKTNTQQTTIDQNKAAITLKADQSNVDTLKGTVNQLQSSLTTQAGQIQEKVTSSQVTGMLTGYATQEYTQSLVTQKANDWNLNLTNLKTDVNAIKTTGGGVNLLCNSNGRFQPNSSKTDNWAMYSTSTVYMTQGQQYTVHANASSGLIWSGTHNPNVTSNNVVLWLTDGIKVSQIISDSNTGTRTTFTWNNPSGTYYLRVNTYKSDNSGYAEKVMLEKGMVAHDWQPSPSDMATVTSVTNLSATVDGIKSTVATKADQSTVTELSNLIQTKVSSGDYNSQITQLKNLINQRVQVGDVISQINQEAGGDTLIQVSNGKKSLILDAENTIITGEAWIPDAAIGSISADKVMLGSSALYNSDGTLNLVNQNNNLKALIQVKQGLVQDTTQSIISFSSDYNSRAFSITPVGATVTPTLFFERYDQTAGHWLGFSRNEVQREGLTFNTWDNDGERFFVSCHARFNKNITAEGIIMQGTWNGTTGKPEAGILSIETGNTIWSGSDYLAIGDHVNNSYTNVIAKSFSQQSTLSAKTNIETVDSKDALDLVNRTDIRSYQYKTDVAQGKTKRYTSLIIDDVNDVSQYCAPDEFTNEERTGRDDGSAVGYLFLAVQELTRRIKTLEEKLNG